MQHVKTGLVSGKPGPLDFHAAKTAHLDAAIGLATPGAAPVFHLHQLAVGMAHKVIHHALFGQPVTAHYSVVKMRLKAVMLLGNGCSATFGCDCVRTHGVDLGHQANTQTAVALLGLFGSSNGSTQTGTAAAYHQHIKISLFHAQAPTGTFCRHECLQNGPGRAVCKQKAAELVACSTGWSTQVSGKASGQGTEARHKKQQYSARVLNAYTDELSQSNKRLLVSA